MKEIISPYAKRIEPHLERILSEMDPDGPLKDACTYAVMGKASRLRSAIVLMIGEQLRPSSELMNGAVAVELLHCASLIVDDLPCMDDDQFRRGKPSLHCAFNETTALLASYALISCAYSQVANHPKAVTLISEKMGLNGLVGGQFLDVQERESWQVVASQKTGALFSLSFVLGWILGNGDESKLHQVEDAGTTLGVLFQAYDDFRDGSPVDFDCSFLQRELSYLNIPILSEIASHISQEMKSHAL